MSRYGTILSTSTLENWTVSHLQRWLPDYLAEASRQAALDDVATVPLPRSYTRRSRNETFPEDQMPRIAVVSPGAAARPVQEGSGLYRVPWRLNIAAFVSISPTATVLPRDVAAIYGSAVYALMVQHPTMSDAIESVDWQGDSLDEGQDDDERQIGVHVNTFVIEVRGVVDASQGLAEPSGNPAADPGDWPAVSDTDTTVQKVSSLP